MTPRIRIRCFDPQQENQRLQREIESLVRNSWGEPGRQVADWLRIARLGFAARTPDGRLVGIALTRRVREDAVWTIATVTDPTLRRSGLAMRLNVAPILNVYETRIRRHWRNLFRGIFLLNRTANPRVYRLLNDRARVYPSVDNAPPQDIHLALLRQVCALSSGVSPDEHAFVLHGASLAYPGLIPPREALPWSGDSQIDALFRDRLELEDEKGNLLFVIARFHPLRSIWCAARKQIERLIPPSSTQREEG